MARVAAIIQIVLALYIIASVSRTAYREHAEFDPQKRAWEQLQERLQSHPEEIEEIQRLQLIAYRNESVASCRSLSFLFFPEDCGTYQEIK